MAAAFASTPGLSGKAPASAAEPEESGVKQDWKAQKEEQARQRKRENDLKKCEDQIALLEKQQIDLEEQMALPENATSSAKLQELVKKQDQISKELETLYELWETLA